MDSIWWPVLDLPRLHSLDLEDALTMHKMGIKMWEHLWDDDSNTWMSRANLIASYNLSDRQLDVIGRRLMHWDPGEWWNLRIKDPLQLKALQWTNQGELWPLPSLVHSCNIHIVLNKR